MDYYITLRTSQTVLITGVTVSPEMVDNDGVLASISSGTYRDIIPSQQGTYVTGTSTTFSYGGPGWSLVLDFGGGTTVTAIETIKDDRLMHVSPRQLTFVETYWKFTCDTFVHFIPVKDVMAMSNSAPTF